MKLRNKKDRCDLFVYKQGYRSPGPTLLLATVGVNTIAKKRVGPYYPPRRGCHPCQRARCCRLFVVNNKIMIFVISVIIYICVDKLNRHSNKYTHIYTHISIPTKFSFPRNVMKQSMFPM